MKDNTITNQLGLAGCIRVALPQNIIAKYLAMVPDPRNTELTEKTFGPASTDVVVWVWLKTGKWNWGTYFARKLGQQMTFYFEKLEPISPGKPRSWEGVFGNKMRLLGRNDVDVSERALEPTFSPDPHATAAPAPLSQLAPRRESRRRV